MTTIRDFIIAALHIVFCNLKRYALHWLTLLVALTAFAVVYCELTAPPKDFPVASLITIPKGSTAREAGTVLALEHVVAHPSVFYFLIRVAGQSVQAGTYRFDTPLGVFSVAGRLLRGEKGVPPIRITFPEGESARQMSEQVALSFPHVSAEDFLASGKPHEGYLFPDTYLFDADATAETVVSRMRETFSTRITSITPDIQKSGHTLQEVVTMASLVEKEARSGENKRIVAGILWHRIALHMPLQVDAVFGYIAGRSTFSPTFDDLAVDSPYNTYTHQGLPPGPIDNPGLDTLTAVVNPIPTPYLYYLTGSDEKMHYATTFAEHKVNRAKYLH